MRHPNERPNDAAMIHSTNTKKSGGPCCSELGWVIILLRWACLAAVLVEEGDLLRVTESDFISIQLTARCAYYVCLLQSWASVSLKFRIRFNGRQTAHVIRGGAPQQKNLSMMAEQATYLGCIFFGYLLGFLRNDHAALASDGSR
jgi:hypothetical protein